MWKMKFWHFSFKIFASQTQQAPEGKIVLTIWPLHVHNCLLKKLCENEDWASEEGKNISGIHVQLMVWIWHKDVRHQWTDEKQNKTTDHVQLVEWCKCNVSNKIKKPTPHKAIQAGSVPRVLNKNKKVIKKRKVTDKDIIRVPACTCWSSSPCRNSVWRRRWLC